MTIEEARTIWLTRLGSDWVDVFAVELDDETVWEAYKTLRLTDSLDKDLFTPRIKIKPK
jgi:hypothetical protein